MSAYCFWSAVSLEFFIIYRTGTMQRVVKKAAPYSLLPDTLTATMPALPRAPLFFTVTLAD